MGARALFRDRADAGEKLGKQLVRYRRASPLVLGLPPGGVAIANEVARILGAPLDVCVVRKLAAPLAPELALGAVGEDESVVLDHDAMARVHADDAALSESIEAKRAAVNDEGERLRRGVPRLDVRSRTVIVVDDGVATGATARAALQTLRARGARTIVLAIPVGNAKTLDNLSALADEVVCLHCEEDVYAISAWYEQLPPTKDADVAALVADSRHGVEVDHGRRPSERVRVPIERDVRIPLGAEGGGASLEGFIAVPPRANALVVCCHVVRGRRSAELEESVAASLRTFELATLTVGLLTEAEETAEPNEPSLEVLPLAERLLAVIEWAHGQFPETQDLDVGCFGVGSGAAAALEAAGARPDAIRAVVSAAGRLDLAAPGLASVRAPTLLLVGGLDGDALPVHRETLYFLVCKTRLEVVHGATPLFEEPEAREHVARAAARWFEEHLRKVPEAADAKVS